MKLISILKSPYPNSGGSWKFIVFVSCFVSIFLLYFEPFGLSNLVTPRKIQIILGYGGVTFLTLIFNLYFLKSIFPKYFHEQNWNVIKHITWLIWILFTIGTGNYFYSVAVITQISAGWTNFLIFQFFTVVIGVFPIIAITLILHTIYREKYGKLAEKIGHKHLITTEQQHADESTKIILKNDSGNEELIFNLEELLFIESMGNYVCIYWVSHQKIEKSTLRCTLKKAMEQLADHPALMQCHRAYIVNTQQVIRVKGNAQGYQLSLRDFNDTIPVSRSFVPEFNAVFNS